MHGVSKARNGGLRIIYRQAVEKQIKPFRRRPLTVVSRLLSVDRCLLTVDRRLLTVDRRLLTVVRCLLTLIKEVLNTHHLAIHIQARESLLEVNLQLFAERAFAVNAHRGEHCEARTCGMRERTIHHVLHRMAFHLLTTHGRKSATDAGKKEAEVFVNLRGSAHRRARIARSNLLLNGNGWRKSLDVVALRLVHTPQELAGVSRKTFYIPSLALGIERVEG